MSIFCLPSKIGAIFLIRLLCSNSKAKQTFPVWSIFSISTGFAPIPALSNISGLEYLLQIHRLCSNFPCRRILPEGKSPAASATGLCLQSENRYFICFHLFLTCLYYNMHKEFCTFLAFGAKQFFSDPTTVFYR